MLRLAAISFLLTALTARAEPRPAAHLLAVLPLDATQAAGKLSKEAQSSIEESLRDTAANVLSPLGWTVLTGETTLQVLADNDIDPLHCGDQNCHLTMAREIKAEKFISGTVQFAEGEFTASVRIIDSSTGRILASAHLEGQSAKELRKQFESQADDFFSRANLGAAPPAATKPVSASTPPGLVSPGAVEIPIDETRAAVLRPKLTLLTDGSGGYLAFDPMGASFDPFFWGTKDALHAQRVTGGGRDGMSSFDEVFWEPRVASRWQASLGMKSGAYQLQCGDKTVPLTVVPDEDAKKIMSTAKLLEVRWSRHLYALARDDVGTYYVVDQAREPETNSNFRLFVGEKGKLDPVAVTDADVDPAGTILTTARGRLAINQGEKKVDWVEGKTKTPLIFLEPEDNTILVYTKLGVYRGERLGTPCDGKL